MLDIFFSSIIENHFLRGYIAFYVIYKGILEQITYSLYSITFGGASEYSFVTLLSYIYIYIICQLFKLKIRKINT